MRRSAPQEPPARLPAALAALCAEVVACRRCPRLVAHRERVAHEKRRSFRDWEYWGQPLPGFGDPAVWNAGNSASGIYFARLTVTDFSGKPLFQQMKRMMLVK